MTDSPRGEPVLLEPRPAAARPGRFHRGAPAPFAIRWFGMSALVGHLRHLVAVAAASSQLDLRDWMRPDEPAALLCLLVLALTGLEPHQGFAVLGHPGYRHFVRLCVHPSGEVEGFVIGKDDPLGPGRARSSSTTSAGAEPEWAGQPTKRPVTKAATSASRTPIESIRSPSSGRPRVRIPTTANAGAAARYSRPALSSPKSVPTTTTRSV